MAVGFNRAAASDGDLVVARAASDLVTEENRRKAVTEDKAMVKGS